MNLVDAIEHAQTCFQDSPLHETATCQWVILPLLHASGYLPREIVPQLKDQNRKLPDYTVLPGTPYTWFLEAKAWHVHLEDAQINQALDYANHNGRRWVVLSNGRTWRLYDNSVQGVASEKLVTEVGLGDTNSMSRLLTAIGKAAVLDGTILLFASEHMSANRVERRRMALRAYLADELSTSGSSVLAAIRELAAVGLGLSDLKETEVLDYFNRGSADGGPEENSFAQPTPNSSGFREQLASACFQVIRQTGGVEIDSATNYWIAFTPKSWSALPKVEKGWSPGGHLVLLWVAVEKGKVKVVVEIGPGPQSHRQSVYDHALANPGLFRPGSGRLYPKYSRIYRRDLVPGEVYATERFDDVKACFESAWHEFRSHDLARIEQAILTVLKPKV